jgi:diaminopimelate epimerase
MTLKFTKMHGLGNDFMVINGIHQSVQLSPEYIRQLSARDTGIGFDQCLIVEPSSIEGIDFFYRIFNANGEPVGQCGNGARCIARFIEYYQLSPAKIFSVATQTTRLELQLNADHSVTVNMGHPQLDPRAIPLNTSTQQPQYTLLLDGHNQSFHALSVGNPHAVLVVDELQNAPVTSLGKAICEHPFFPEQVNVGFLKLHTPSHIQLRVYERGCGETRACGSGAVAAMAAGRLYHQLDTNVRVSLPGGDLWIQWSDIKSPIFMTGSASFVYEGELF